MARLDRKVQEIRNHALHVEEGLLSRQLRDGRVLRAAQGRVLLCRIGKPLECPHLVALSRLFSLNTRCRQQRDLPKLA